MFPKDVDGYDAHAKVCVISDEKSGLLAVIAMHRIIDGRAGGGTRFRPYHNLADATRDVMLLSKAMTNKYALAGIRCGGGKAVIIGDANREKAASLLHAFGDAIAMFGGTYFASPDVGTNGDDMRVIGERTPFIRGLPERTGDSSVATAIGVHHAMRAAALHRFGTPSLVDLRVAIQGVGGVGGYLARLLAQDGAALIIADHDPMRAAAIGAATGARVVETSVIMDSDVDILAPCALGGTVTTALAQKTGARVICGAANNQLADPAVGAMLADRGILFVPDYVANSGGVIVGMSDDLVFDPVRAYAPLASIEDTCAEIFKLAHGSGLPTQAIADGLACSRLSRVSGS